MSDEEEIEMKNELRNNNDLSTTKPIQNPSEQEYIKKLFCQTRESYGEKYHEHYLALYKMYASTAEKISDRRQSNNSFFLTLNTAIIAVVSYLQLGEEAGKSIELYWLISVSGIIVCYAWYRLIKSYKQLNSGKFKIVNLIEKNLPIAPYDAEWEALERGKNHRLFIPFNKIETIVPWLFMGIHIAVLIRVFPWNSIMLFFLSVF